MAHAGEQALRALEQFENTRFYSELAETARAGRPVGSRPADHSIGEQHDSEAEVQVTGHIPFDKYRPHPWHGLSPGSDPPRVLRAYIEITPFDPVKYEIDKATGYLRVDRPQRSSSLPPALYGFVPQTYCGLRVAALSHEVTQADGDPLDICVLSERPINRSEVLVDAVVVGGLRGLDNGVADDKIIAVLLNDNVWGTAVDIADIPLHLVERLEHYFATYKMIPGQPSTMVIQEVYGVAHAVEVVRAAIDDYNELYGRPSDAEPGETMAPERT